MRALGAAHTVETSHLSSAARSLTLDESHQGQRKSCVQHKRRLDLMPTGPALLLELRRGWCRASMREAYLRRYQTRAATNAKWSPFLQSDSSREELTNSPR